MCVQASHLIHASTGVNVSLFSKAFAAKRLCRSPHYQTWSAAGLRNCRVTVVHNHISAELAVGVTMTQDSERRVRLDNDRDALSKPVHQIDTSKQGVLEFVKYQGLGNDFLLVDNRHSSVPAITAEQAISLCDRNFGVGGDGVIFVMPGLDGSDYSMRIFNSDGSEPEMCGNGIRCMARFIAKLENEPEMRSYKIHTLAGTIIPQLQEDDQVVVDMGPPSLSSTDIPTHLPASKDGSVIQVPLVVDGVTWSVTCVSMGNPHCVIFVEDVDFLALSDIGPLFEHNEVFPARTNTEFVQVVSPSHLRMRVWERGAGATLACGTGACAVVVAAVLAGHAERVSDDGLKSCTVDLPGGPLEIEWREDNHVYMCGPAKAVFTGSAFLE